MLKKEIMFSLWQKKISDQEMQISTKSNAEISRNMSKSNYNNKIMWKRMISDNDVSATSLMIECDKKSSINKWKKNLDND